MPNDFFIKQFDGADKTYSLICRHRNNDPKTNQNTIVEW